MNKPEGTGEQEYGVPVHVSFEGTELEDLNSGEPTYSALENIKGSVLLEKMQVIQREIREILSRRGGPRTGSACIEIEVKMKDGAPEKYFLREYVHTGPEQELPGDEKKSYGQKIRALSEEMYDAGTLERHVDEEDQKSSDAQLFIEGVISKGIATSLAVEDLEGRTDASILLRDVFVPQNIRAEVLKQLEGVLETTASKEVYGAFKALSQVYNIPEIFSPSGRVFVCKGSVWARFDCDSILEAGKASLSPDYKYSIPPYIEEAKGFIDGYVGRNVSGFKKPSMIERALSSQLVLIPAGIVCESARKNRLRNFLDREEKVHLYQKGIRKGRKAKGSETPQ